MSTAAGVKPAADGLIALFGHDPATYVPHPVHAGDRTYHETDCYTDILIELVHARGDEPLAVLGSLVRLDFEGDQWTFFKPDPRDLEDLLGIDIHEMQPWRPLPDQIAELLETGRTMTIELDAWFLPDTAATSYRREHVKTSVIPEAIDRAAETLRYYHNASLYELAGEDYRGVFRLDAPRGSEVLPPYTELVRFDAGPRLAGDALRGAALDALRHHLARIPADDPFARFGDRLEADLPGLLDGDEAAYHAYAFATVRMAGAGFELLAAQVAWLLGDRASPVTTPLARVVEGSKTLGFKLARRRPFDPRPMTDAMGADRDEALTALRAAVG